MPERLPMRLFADLSKRWPALLAGALACGALALLWRTRDTALELGASTRIDALSAFFLFALFGGAALVLAAWPAPFSLHWWRPVAAMGALTLAYSTTRTLAIACAYLALALLTLDRQPVAPTRGQRPVRFEQAARALRRASLATPGLLAAGCQLLGYGALALRGATHYDDRTAGSLLDSFAFWFVLLAAVIASSPLFHPMIDHRPPTTDHRPPTTDHRPPTTDDGATAEHAHPLTRSETSSFIDLNLFRFAWLYPLARLYSLGPWNSGWSFATLLLGGALALWYACSALARPALADRNTRVQAIYLALALAGLGLGTSAGVAAMCYGVLTYLVLAIGYGDWRPEIRADRSDAPISNLSSPISGLLPWLVSSAAPLTAPFVAAWMLISASVAGGVPLLAGVAWLAALLHGLIAALWGDTAPAQARRPLLVAGVASLVLGVGAPPIVGGLIQPVVARLQGGLTPYGDVNIWPWVGLAASDSAHTQVTTLPSIAIALLMLVLSALVYVVARLREVRGAGSQSEAAGVDVPAATLLSRLREEVPWLGGLLGLDSGSQGQPGDGE
jgi:hypothetical protein